MVSIASITELETDQGVTSSNSSVDPYNIPSIFAVPHRGPNRSGLKDPTLTFRFAPLSFARDQTRPTWAIDLGITTGLVPVKTAVNSATPSACSTGRKSVHAAFKHAVAFSGVGWCVVS